MYYRTCLISFILFLCLCQARNGSCQNKIWLDITDNRKGNLKEAFEPEIIDFLQERHYTIVPQKKGADVEIKMILRTNPGPCAKGLCVAYTTLNTTMTDLLSGEKILEQVYPQIKGGGVTMESATVNSVKNALKAVSDVLALKLAEVKDKRDMPRADKPPKSQPGPSDVDLNIPKTTLKSPNVFALVIGNEDYSSFQPGLNTEVNVAFAASDARIFAQYLTSTFGVPQENIQLLMNAKAMDINKELKRLNLMAKTKGEEAELIFYYAGHGLPDEKTKEPYLIPVDVSGRDLEYAIKLNEVYENLSEYPVQKITVFLDACFSGGARNSPLLATRGVKIKPSEVVLKGNIVVFTSSSGEQSSLPYQEKSHGLFTYFLLKNLQEHKGSPTLESLGDDIRTKVGEQAVKLFNKEQTPSVQVSPDAEEKWKKWKLVGF